MLKSLIKRSIRNLGFDVSRYEPSSSENARFMAMLKAHQVNLIFDVGANAGQFGKQLRNASYKGDIVSFEPLSLAREQLLVASEKDKKWKIAPQAAIGETDGEIEIHVAGNSVSSSILKMLDSHSQAAPESSYVGSEKVPLRRLDSIGKPYLCSDSVFFIKIDTQGYEDRVLNGAPELLERAIGVQLELSLIPLYEGQRLYNEIIFQLQSLSFELWGINTAFVEPTSGRLLQVDATFFRKASHH